MIHSKLPDTGTTIFTVMSQLAAEYNAINLGQGFPDFMMSKELISLVNAAMLKGNNQYVHMNGLLLLREDKRCEYRLHWEYPVLKNPVFLMLVV